MHPTRKPRPAKNTGGIDLPFLSARISSGMSFAPLPVGPVGRRRRRKDSGFLVLGEGFMKDVSAMLLATAIVIFSLIGLLSAASTLDRTSSTLDNDQQRISEVGLRFAFKR